MAFESNSVLRHVLFGPILFLKLFVPTFKSYRIATRDLYYCTATAGQEQIIATPLDSLSRLSQHCLCMSPPQQRHRIPLAMVLPGCHCLVGVMLPTPFYFFPFFFLTLFPISTFLLLRKKLFFSTPYSIKHEKTKQPKRFCLRGEKKKSKRPYLWKGRYSYLSLPSVPVSRITNLHSCYLPTQPLQANTNPEA